MNLLFVLLGGALGSLARYLISEALVLGGVFPWGTLAVNVSGSFVIGFAAGGAGFGGRFIDSPFVRHFVMVGLCGGYTTFSAFSLQTVTLLQAGDFLRVVVNVVTSVLACLLATLAGFSLAAVLAR